MSRIRFTMEERRIAHAAELFEVLRDPCSGQVISDSKIDFFNVDSRSKALGDKLPSVECSRMLL